MTNKSHKVNVNLQGVAIGTAEIHADGAMDFEMIARPSTMGKDLYERLEKGVPVELYIVAPLIDVHQAAKHNINLNGATNVQVGHNNTQENRYRY